MQHIICEIELSQSVKGQTLINILRELASDPHVQILDNGYKLLGSRSVNGFYGFKVLVDDQELISSDYWYTKVMLVHWDWPGDHQFRDHLVLQKTAYLNDLAEKFRQEVVCQ